jgi:hypothetical protein
MLRGKRSARGMGSVVKKLIPIPKNDGRRGPTEIKDVRGELYPLVGEANEEAALRIETRL